MTRWIVTIRSDDGIVRITTNATTKEIAIRNVLAFENAPESAVMSVEKVKRGAA